MVEGSNNLLVSHHLAKFGSHRHCSSREKVYKVCCGIRQDHVIKGSSDYDDGSPSR